MSDCEFTLLPQSTCSHCTKAVEVVVEPEWEKHDYASLELTEFGRPQGERQVIPNKEQFTTDVTPLEIYGPEKVFARLSRTRKES